ncbi:hypothetical protein ED733_002790 [Metarhizium rileyi]|uniref:Uncharacterized protein n=1 Tax=Metarhizium rileyi (strain RCEF 4871) TaxID=1649241 RepID=A0A5C6G582_METRR|nr:hypothetical protein ED733_002790 [Metarhizium rileyi]
MGMQGPLTAQALGRSPYDEVVDGEGEDDPRQPVQQYDHRGRPINPETKKINRDIIRAHNEVMLVIGVAEPENPYSGPEAESQRRHDAYEDSIGRQLADSTLNCIDSVGIFGAHSLRQRILIYKRYSHIPFWELFQRARNDFSFTKDILAGSPTAFLTHHVERMVPYEVWSYFRVHLELYIALQRLGITPNVLFLPPLSFFIPFTETSPIPAPPPLDDYTVPSLLKWCGGVLISTTPFLVWVMTQRMIRDWKPQRQFVDVDEEDREQSETSAGDSPELTGHSTPAGQSGQPPMPRRASIFSTRGDEYPSDDEDNEGISATLISFDVEASESQDAPPGLWSAELRPSAGPDPRSNGNKRPVYLDTLLTQMPALIATHMLSNAAIRLIIAPYEATALRLIVPLVNFLGAELLHINLASEVWAFFACVSQWFLMTEEEWKTKNKKT